MKVLINNYIDASLKADQRHELPGNTLVEFWDDAGGTKYEITQNPDGRGIQVRKVAPVSSQIHIEPRYSNAINIL